MISDDEIRGVLRAAGAASETRPNPVRVTRGISPKQARRGTHEFDVLMEELEDEWELDEEELDNIVEIRRSVDGDSFEIRFKGEDRWELLEDDEEAGSDGEDSDVDRDGEVFEGDSLEEE